MTTRTILNEQLLKAAIEGEKQEKKDAKQRDKQKKKSLEDLIQIENDIVLNQIDQLTKQNEDDQEELDQLKQGYHNIILTGIDKEMNEAKNKMDDYTSRIARRKEAIEVLQSNENPRIQSLITDAVNGWMNTLESIEGEGLQKVAILKQKRDELLNEVVQLIPVQQKAMNLRAAIDQYSKRLDSMTRNRLGMNRGIDVSTPITKGVNGLLIQRQDVYKL